MSTAVIAVCFMYMLPSHCVSVLYTAVENTASPEYISLRSLKPACIAAVMDEELVGE